MEYEIYQWQFISEKNCLYEYISARRCSYIENNENKPKILADLYLSYILVCQLTCLKLLEGWYYRLVWPILSAYT